jgi:hypothetical protein
VSYRPITDIWILARPKVKYYGAYPNGFLERAKNLLGVSNFDSTLHVFSGQVKQYPNWEKLCKNDVTIDAVEDTDPDYIWNMNKPLDGLFDAECVDAILADPPYTAYDHSHYALPPVDFVSASQLIKSCWPILKRGGRIGVLHTTWPRPPKNHKLVAAVGVLMGYGNVIRIYSVYEKV